MAEPLFLTDLVLAFVLAVTGGLLGRRAGRSQAQPGSAQREERQRPLVLYVTAGVVAARLAVAVLLLATSGWQLVGHRFLLGLPVVVLPLVWALVRRTAVAAHTTAIGAWLSFYFLYVPPGPQDLPIAVGASAIVLATTIGISLLLGDRRSRGGRLARLPWLSLVASVVTAAALGSLFLVSESESMDWGGGPERTGHSVHAMGHRHGAEAPAMRSVDELTGPREGTPDARFTLTAAHSTVRLSSGRKIDALTFNGTSPGPELRVKQGQLVEVTLVNKDVAEGVTLHWHGVDVPNAEDGVPGITQNPVRPGERHVYRFIPDRTGTYWYHTHRDSERTVERGLFGALIVEDGQQGVQRNVFTHLWPGGGKDQIGAFGTADTAERRAIPAGSPVVLRLINSSKEPHRILLGGTPFRVTAHDGNPIGEPGELKPGTDLFLAAGGRYDVAFTMPDGAVTLRLDTSEIPNKAGLAFSPDGRAAPAELQPGRLFDRLSYGSRTGPKPEGGPYQRTFNLVLDNGFGFTGGSFTYTDTINGRLSPAVPTLMVHEGDRVRIRITARGIIDHPMHLHGHRVRVLSRNGEAVSGSAWWTDTLNVAPGESYELDFTADNPGVWMDHCHNFEHAESGMIMHLAYDDVTTPYHGPAH
ncbi:multicopper oxidase family protein [Streptomyces sp. NBC_00829]|uniref:multicopper oxidase family protein n=1 Tax=Streptomyces sp. NBC_00829 TaxID=2903679 RepID=UPI0038667908|nr:multicopper oxidase family protein [Streptomyces sp. NBC_00829]